MEVDEQAAQAEAAARELRDKAARREAAQSSAAARAAEGGDAATRAAAAVAVVAPAAAAEGPASPSSSDTSSPTLRDHIQPDQRPKGQQQQQRQQQQQQQQQQQRAQHAQHHAAAGAAPAAAAADACAQCGAAAVGVRKLLVCTRCRSARYCSDACQRAAWPRHKARCTAAMKARLADERAAAAAAAADSKRTSSSGGAAADGEQQQQLKDEGVLDALGGLLQRHADARPDALQKQFEAAVVQFVRGEYRLAAAALTEAAARARAAGRLELAGDAMRWLGHAHNRLGAPGRAAAAFAEGAAVAAQVQSKRLQVDCLSGLGMTHRAQLQHAEAVSFLRQALAVAEVMEGPAAGPARASVMTNLGSALMGVDPEEAARLLREAVALREAQVVELHNAGEKNGIATAIMEHASALVNLAGALYVGRRYGEARDAYSQSLEVFELVGDGDKIAKALVNLANLHELQLEEPGALEAAAGYRSRLYGLAKKMIDRDPPESCAICMEAIEPLSASRPAVAAAAAEAAHAAAGAGGRGGAAGAGAAAEGGEAGGAAAEEGAGEADGAAAAAEGAAAEGASASADQGAAAADGAAADNVRESSAGVSTEGAGAAPADGAPAAAVAPGGVPKAAKANRLIVLACLHCYHHGCWDAWTDRSENASCPSCKQPVPLY